MKALVTGSSGLLGSMLVRILRERGWPVQGIDRHESPTTNSVIDCRDFFRRVQARYDLVFHCAATVGGREKLERDPLAYAANIETDAAFMGWAARTNPGYALYVSSCNAYPVDLGPFPVHESALNLDRLGLPDGTYGWAKLTGEYLAPQAGVAVARPFGIYGPGQAPCHPLANFVAQARQHADPITVWGSGCQVRDFIHVGDCARALLAMADNDIREPVNIGSGKPVTLISAAGHAATAAGYLPKIRLDPFKPEGLPYRCADITRMREFYTPRITLTEGLRGMIQHG